MLKNQFSVEYTASYAGCETVNVKVSNCQDRLDLVFSFMRWSSHMSAKFQTELYFIECIVIDNCFFNLYIYWVTMCIKRYPKNMGLILCSC